MKHKAPFFVFHVPHFNFLKVLLIAIQRPILTTSYYKELLIFKKKKINFQGFLIFIFLIRVCLYIACL